MKQIIFATILALVFSISAFAQSEKSPCPTIDISGGAPVDVGEQVTFAVVSNSGTENLTVQYEWSVSSGIIISGQGTPTITIDTTDIPSGTSFTVKVKVTGLPENCKNIAEDTGAVIPRIPLELFDEYGKLTDNEVKYRVLNLYVQLGNLPNYQGYIINYGTNKELANRERQIQRTIKFYKLDSNRLTLVRGGSNLNDGVWTKVWVLPPGAELPTPDME